MVAVTSQSGSLGNRYGYDPFGKVTTTSGSVANPWGFASGYLDITGLVKFGARYYDPNLGRWTQQDPISGSIMSPSGLNRYIYAAGDPTNVIDSSGALPAWVDWLSVGLGVVGLGLAVAGAVITAPLWLSALLIAAGIAVAFAGVEVALAVLGCDYGVIPGC